VVLLKIPIEKSMRESISSMFVRPSRSNRDWSFSAPWTLKKTDERRDGSSRGGLRSAIALAAATARHQKLASSGISGSVTLSTPNREINDQTEEESEWNRSRISA
jgi:hypothetical protein